jgi:putative transposase
MPNYRRYYVPGGTYFFTIVTHERRPLFAAENNRTLLREAIQKQQEKRPFEIIACVLLPDHMHLIVSLPPGDDKYSLRIGQIKEAFTTSYLRQGGTEPKVSRSRTKHRERAIWQRRFWEHTVRDEDDLQRCADYVHWNPVKHALAKRPYDWEWSTFRNFVARGHYSIDWGRSDPCAGYDAPEWE